MSRAPVSVIVEQHAHDAAVLRNTRSFLVRAPHVKLHQLARHDERLAAHLDGLAVAGQHGAQLASAALENPGCAEVFVATVGVIEGLDPVGLERLFALVEGVPALRAGLFSAFGWVPGASLQGITRLLLESPGALQRQIGLGACCMHGVDPGDALDAALTDANVALRARALRMVAQIGEIELLPVCVGALADRDEACACAAARAAVLLGHRGDAISALQRVGLMQGPWQRGALDLLLKVQSPTGAQTVLAALAQDAAAARAVVRGVGVAGDPHFLPWLVQQMDDARLARLAGEAFSLITGLDLAQLGLERSAPRAFETIPNDDPDDDGTAMDEDDGLPWPDPDKLGAWLKVAGTRFEPGTRYFMGQPPSPAHCLAVLKDGFQRQRTAAAVYLCLLTPGTPLFNTAAPAWRQQAWLASMGA